MMKKYLYSACLFLITGLSLAQSDNNFIQSNNRFSFDLFQKLKNSTGNLIFSPASVTSAMAMTYIGAKENTFDEISNTFHFIKDIDTFNNDYLTFNNLHIKKESNVKFYFANSLWIQEDLSLSPVFIENNQRFFSSSLNYTDFRSESEQSRLKVNKWVEKNTNNKIKDLLKPSVIDNTTRLVLVNAIYFNGSWKTKFNKKNNTRDKFQVGKRKYIDTDFMNGYIDSWYYDDQYVQIVDIPYADKEYSLMVILPKKYKKFGKLEKTLNYDFYLNYIEKKERKRIKLSLPKFTTESEFDLNKTLSDMGIKDAFTNAADFSGITKNEKLYISNVIHKANISVDEEGTEAAAATAVNMRKMAVLLDEAEFNANKPFIYILRNTNNNTIYFFGKVIKP